MPEMMCIIEKMFFILKKIITPFLLPPGLFILLLISSGTFFIRRNNRQTGIFNIAIGVLIWLISTAPVSQLLLRGLEADFQIPQNPPGDVIIILGGGIIDKVPDLSGIGEPSEIMLGRIVTAVRLQKKLKIPIIISGGKVYKNKSAGAPIIKRFLIDLGINENSIIVEEESRDTIENAEFTKEICLAFGFKRPIILTSAYHLKRSQIAFERVDIKPILFPASFRTKKNANFSWYSFLPSAGNLMLVSIAIHEYLGILYYKILY